MLVLGLSGSFSAGKGTFIEIVNTNFNACGVSTSDAVRSEAATRGIEKTRQNLRKLVNEMVAEKGGAVLVEFALKSIKPCDVLVVDGLRRKEEIFYLKDKFKNNFHLVWLDAPIEKRYERILARKRESEEFLSFEQFKADEAKEFDGSNSQNLNECKSLAEIFVENDSSREIFEEKIVSLVKNLLN